MGYDFLLDKNLRPWLLEVNTNPCLEMSCAYLSALIPNVIDNAFRIGLDPIFPSIRIGKKLHENKFELIFNSSLIK